MHLPMKGVRVLEVAQFWFVPSAGAVLADWGANVIKVEHPERGDGQRGLATSGIATEIRGVDFLVQQPNRGKKSLALDFGKPEGLELLYRLAKQSDVFLTNFLPDARERLKIDVADIRKVNPAIIYVRGITGRVRAGSARRPPDPDHAEGRPDRGEEFLPALRVHRAEHQGAHPQAGFGRVDPGRIACDDAGARQRLDPRVGAGPRDPHAGGERGNRDATVISQCPEDVVADFVDLRGKFVIRSQAIVNRQYTSLARQGYVPGNRASASQRPFHDRPAGLIEKSDDHRAPPARPF